MLDLSSAPLKSACFVCFLKCSMLLRKLMHVSEGKFSKELKNGIEILVGQATFELCGSKQSK